MSRVLVVGGNVAGLSVAEGLLSAGFKVDVCDLEEAPYEGKPQKCAGGVSKWFLEDKLRLRLPRSVILTQIETLRFYAPNGKFFEGKGGFGYVLDRNRLQRWLTEKVEKLGGTVHWNHKIEKKKLDYLAGKYDYIIGADGLLSTVGSWMDAELPSPRDISHCLQRVVEWEDHPQDVISIYFERSIVPLGYAWSFPIGDDRVRVGLGIPLSLKENPRKFLDKFMDKLGLDGKYHEQISKLVPTSQPRNSNAFLNRVLLVGDAGLHTGPFGGGILQSIYAARMCTEAIVRGEPEKFDKYVGWLWKRNKRARKFIKLLMKLDDDGFNELAEALQGVEIPLPLDEPRNLRKLFRVLLTRKPSIFL